MSERITQELRGLMEKGHTFVDFTGNVARQDLFAEQSAFEMLCDSIDSIHANLERENDRLKCELDRVLGELDEVHKTDGISDNTSGFMHDEKRSIGSAVVTITPTLDWMGVARELRSIADTLVGDVS